MKFFFCFSLFFFIAQPLFAGGQVFGPHILKPQTRILNGSAGIFGDPHIGLFTPQILNNMEVETRTQWKNIATFLEMDREYLLLRDPDSELEVYARTTGVNPMDPSSSVGIGTVVIKTHLTQIVFDGGNGSIVINGTEAGNTVKKGTQIFKVPSAIFECHNEILKGYDYCLFWDNEYRIKIFPRSPHPDAKNYFDLSFEENYSNAAANADGDTLTVPIGSIPYSLSLADLLDMEMDSPLTSNQF